MCNCPDCLKRRGHKNFRLGILCTLASMALMCYIIFTRLGA